MQEYFGSKWLARNIYNHFYFDKTERVGCRALVNFFVIQEVYENCRYLKAKSSIELWSIYSQTTRDVLKVTNTTLDLGMENHIKTSLKV